jgi:hypothetical protein
MPTKVKILNYDPIKERFKDFDGPDVKIYLIYSNDFDEIYSRFDQLQQQKITLDEYIINPVLTEITKLLNEESKLDSEIKLGKLKFNEKLELFKNSLFKEDILDLFDDYWICYLATKRQIDQTMLKLITFLDIEDITEKIR